MGSLLDPCTHLIKDNGRFRTWGRSQGSIPRFHPAPFTSLFLIGLLRKMTQFWSTLKFISIFYIKY